MKILRICLLGSFVLIIPTLLNAGGIVTNGEFEIGDVNLDGDINDEDIDVLRDGILKITSDSLLN